MQQGRVSAFVLILIYTSGSERHQSCHIRNNYGCSLDVKVNYTSAKALLLVLYFAASSKEKKSLQEGADAYSALPSWLVKILPSIWPHRTTFEFLHRTDEVNYRKNRKWRVFSENAQDRPIITGMGLDPEMKKLLLDVSSD